MGVLLCLLRRHQSTVQNSTIVADLVDVVIGHRLLVGQQLLQQVLFVKQLQRDCLLLLVVLAIGLDEMVQHFRDLLSYERDAPLEDVHEVGQQVGMLVLKELLDVERVVLSEAFGTLNLMTAPLLL